MQLGEASADEAFRIRYFPLSLTGPAFTWFTYLPAHSICSWKDLEQKFHAHYYIGSSEKKLIDLTTLRQRNNETPMEFLRRFRKTKSMCFSLNIPDDQLASMAVAGMLPAIREKLFGMEFDDLGYLLLTVKIRQPSHEFTFGVGISFIPYPLVLTPAV
jgi:hypothetical protein